MGALTRFGAAVLVVMASPVIANPPPAVARWQTFIDEASSRFGVPESWVERVMTAESAGRTMLAGQPIRSHAGALGLMQLMPATWSDMRLLYGLGEDAQDPHDNIVAGTAYLRIMYDRFGYPGLFAAYNAGPARYAQHLATGAPLPAETRAYMASVAGGPTASTTPVTTSTPAIFAIGSAGAGATNGLFAIRHDERSQSSGGI